MKKKFVILALVTLMAAMLACGTIPDNIISQITIVPELFPTQTPAAANPSISPETQEQQSQVQPTAVISSPTELLQSQEILVNLYKSVSPGVVSIQILSETGGGMGSGFVYDKLGHILTNYHVVEGAQDLEVDFPSGIKVRGQVIGTDLDSDLAVIKVDVPADQLYPLPLGDSDMLQVGQMVIAIGNPFGLSGTMTLGIISAKGRNLESIRTTAEGRSFSAGDVIQTDASINPGNSGGPLLNLNGEVVGINRAIRTTGQTATGEPVNSGIGFAVSVNIVKRVAPVLIAQGNYDYPYLGISAIDEVSLVIQEALGLSQSSGAYLVEVTPGGPADKAGLRAGTKETDIAGLLGGGDLIIAIDSHPVRVYGDLIAYLMTQKSPGDDAILTILRDGQPQEVTVKLDKRP